MTSQPPIAHRILLFGKDAQLLETRALVLRRAGMVVDVAIDIDIVRVLKASPRSTYEVVVCCHTASEAQYNEVIAINSRNRTSLMKLGYPVSPLEIIDQVSSLIREGHSRIDGSKRRPST
jgi:hypothetical protein